MTTYIQHQSAFLLADCHLQPDGSELPPSSKHFIELIDAIQSSDIQACFILGDLFDYWIGDDDGINQYPAIITALKALTDSGKSLYFQHGNRDFLVGEVFLQQTKAALLPEHTCCTLGNFTVSVSHGDELCTSDTDYQAFRQVSRNPQWIANFLARPLTERQQQGQQAREASKQALAKLKEEDKFDVTDIDENTFKKLVEKYPAVNHFIHGHTHRPTTHNYSTTQRWVLGDWYGEGLGECIRIDRGNIAFHNQIAHQQW